MTIQELIQTDDETLVKYCLEGNRKAQEALYRKYAKPLYRVALIYVENDNDAADVLQDSFLKFFRNLKRFSFDCSIKTWLRKIVINTAITLYNKKKKTSSIFSPLVHEDIVEDTKEIPEDALSLSSSQVVNLINQLPQKAKMILKLYSIEGYTHKEIASTLNISEGTSKSQLNRARRLLQQLKAQHYG